MNKVSVLVDTLVAALPGLQAVYLFGSHAQGTATENSDLDLAVLMDGNVDVVELWRLSGELAEISGTDVDLINLRSASTIMQYQIITKGKRCWVKEPAASLFETHVLSDKTALDEARAGLLSDIQKEGRIYGG